MEQPKCQMDTRELILTIEKRLEVYANTQSATERHEILWHAWKHNQRWLSQLLEWVMPSFPIYSRHGQSHARAILHNIEMILGQEQIYRLSASDCFLILHVVYIHDIGMCITHSDRAELMKNKEFVNFLNYAKNSSDRVLAKYAELLLRYCEEMPKMSNPHDMLAVKLDVYYAILYMVAEYRRKNHGNQSEMLLKEWIDKPEKLGIGFSTSGIPSRFFYTIAACAGVHTSYEFGDVMKLHKVDTGYTHDFMHPRFAAVLLQLGDALDLDNDRFHPLVKEFSSEIPQTSETHYGKHKSIRRLRISPDKITIEADCENAEVLRLVNTEYECIEDILKNATYNWSAICPDELTLCLPVLEPIKLLMNGNQVKDELVNVKFVIQQEKAFNILQGSNIYKEDSFVFLREIFQNAIDASKLQYWTDWKCSRWYDERISVNELEIKDMGKRLSPLSYPVEVEFYLAKKEKYGKNCIILTEEGENNEEEIKKDYQYGVLVRMIDHGVGMTAEDIKVIANVGTSYVQRKNIIEEMPQWLTPTAEFGIGLQAVFLVADSMVAYSYPRTGEKYKVEFQTTGDGGRGYIGVTPLLSTDSPKSFGTIFEVFVSNDKKKKHQEDLESWRSRDPFEVDYEKNRNIRHTKELQLQLAIYLNSLIGEKLFPVELRMHKFDLDEEKPDENKKERGNFEDRVGKKFKNVNVQFLKFKEHFIVENDAQVVLLPAGKEKYDENIAWVYSLEKYDKDVVQGNEEEKYVIGNVENDFQYAFDCKDFKLHLWNPKKGVCARFGGERIQALRDILKHPGKSEKESYIRMFYKGVYVKPVDWNEDMGILEYLDIKGKLKREYLAINRCDFTEKGNKYIHDEVYISVLHAAHKALEDCDKKGEVFSKIKTRIGQLIQDSKSETEIQEVLLSIVGLSAYAQNKNVGEYLAPNGQKKCDKWKVLLEDISGSIEEAKKARKYTWTESTFFNLNMINICLDENGKIYNSYPETKNIAQVMYDIQNYAIVSKRNHRNASWEKNIACMHFKKDNSDDRIKTKILGLKNKWKIEERRPLADFIEKWGVNLTEDLQSNVKGELFSREAEKILSRNAICDWIMKNIPSIAMFSSVDSKVRVNLLDSEYTDSMYFDINSKWSMYERMYEIYQDRKIKRFCTIAPTGYCQIALEKKPASIYFVKRGDFSATGQRYVIVPLDGKALGLLFDELSKYDIASNKEALPEDIKFFMEYDKFIRKVGTMLIESKTNVFGEEEFEFGEYMGALYKEKGALLSQYIEDMFFDKIKKITKEEKEDEQIQVPDESFEEEMFLELLKWTLDKSEYSEKNQNVIQKKVIYFYKKVCERKKSPKDFDRKEIIKKLFQNCGLQENDESCYNSNKIVMDRLIAYVCNEGWIRLQKEQVKNLYQLYVSELAYDIECFAKRSLERKIKDSYLLALIIGD